MTEFQSDAANALTDLIAGCSAHALGCALLREDRLAASLSPRELDVLVEAALADGSALAGAVGHSWSCDPEAVAAANGIPVEDSTTDAGYGTTIVFAQYRSHPLGIVLYRPAIAELDRQLRAWRLSALLGIHRTRPMFLAHELYHHFDEARPSPLCSRHRVPVLRFGRLHVTAPLTGMREIAAGAFAQRLLGLRFHPRAFDTIVA